MKDTNDFAIKSGVQYITFRPSQRDLQRNYRCDNTENNINIIELFYHQEDEGGWGAGGGEYITTQDIASISKGIQQITNKEIKKFSYHCLNDIIQIHIARNENHLITFTVSMLETLEGKYHISITLKDLSLFEFTKYTKVFIEWERKFPTLDPAWLDLYHEAYNKVYENDCDLQSRCEASFHIKVDEILNNEPYKLGDFLNRVTTYFRENTDVETEAFIHFIEIL